MIKKIVLLFAMLFLAIQANASVIDLGDFDASVGRADAYLFDNGNGLATNTPVDASVIFTISNAGSGASAAITAVSLELNGFINIDNFGATLNGTALTLSSGSGGTTALFQGLLGDGMYTLLFSGDVTGSGGGIINGAIAVEAVPLPAAVWLFGSALIGLFSFRRSNLASA